MQRPFNDTDQNKRVMTSDGRDIGKVRTVKDGRATIEQADEESLSEEVLDMLGWDDTDDTHELDGEHVSRRDDDGIHLSPGR